jgi:hypothetical protein
MPEIPENHNIENNLQKFLSQRSESGSRDPMAEKKLDDSLLKEEPKQI